MKRIIFAAIASIYSLTAIGQAPQYFDSWLLTPSIANGCISVPFMSAHYNGTTTNASYLNSTGYAQPYFTDSTISIKGIALMGSYYHPYDTPCTFDTGYYLQIRDEKIDEVLASVRYDTTPYIKPEETWGTSNPTNLNNYVELLFDSTIFITAGNKFYTVMTMGNDFTAFQCFRSTVHYIAEMSSCYQVAELPSVLSDGEWQTLPQLGTYMPILRELCIFPILDTLTYHGGNLTQVDLENLTYIYPSPASKEVTVASSFGLEGVEVINAVGQKVYERQIKANSITIDVSNFAKGSYIARIRTNKGVTTKKFIVQ